MSGLLFLRTFAGVPEATKEQYEKRTPKDGVVLVAVNWGRLWGVNGAENAELRGISFDLAGRHKLVTEKADLEMEGPSGVLARIAVKPVFLNYAIILPEGRYLMSGFDVKVARSAQEIYHIKADRSQMVVENDSKLGYFDVKAGETVYIGNFFLDKAMEPYLWRYYSPLPEAFQTHLAEFRSKYPFLPIENVKYRLFETSTIGNKYPEPPEPNHSPEPTPGAVH